MLFLSFCYGNYRPSFYELPVLLESLWRIFFHMVNISCALPARAVDLISSWRSFSSSISSTEMWIFRLHTFSWAIWKERNRLVFDNSIGDLCSVWESFLFLVPSWSRCDCYYSTFSFKLFRCNLRLILLTYENDL